jgi:hypothetical protein
MARMEIRPNSAQERGINEPYIPEYTEFIDRREFHKRRPLCVQQNRSSLKETSFILTERSDETKFYYCSKIAPFYRVKDSGALRSL